MSLADVKARLAQIQTEPRIIDFNLESEDAQKVTQILETGDVEEFATELPAKEYDTIPRQTLLRLCSTPREQNFTFKTETWAGEHYLQAMRMVLTRARAKMRKAKRQPQEFKLFLVSIVHEEKFDVVTVVRTEQRSTVARSQYDDLLDAMQDSDL